jgi:hypothetical protein
MAKQILTKLVLLAAAALVAGCGSAPEASAAGQAQPKATTKSSDVLRFVREEKGSRQSLELRKRSGGGFDAAISVAGVCSRTEAGAAKAVRTEGDVEVEVDPDGEGHPTDSFVLTGRDKCRVEIRLAAPDREYAWLRESDCATDCPLSRRAMTRK